MDFVLNTIALLSLTISLCFFLFRFSKTSSKQKEPPTVSGSWPIIGHLPLLSNTQTPHKTLGALVEKYGPIFTINIGSKQAIILNNWELAKECFTTNDMAVSSRPNLVSTENMCYNGAMFGVAPYGNYWRKIRKIATLQILTNRRVAELGHFRVSEVRTTIKELYDVWCNKRKENSNNDDEYVVVEIKQWFEHLAFNMVIQMAIGRRYFGSNSTSVVEKEAQKCIEALKEFMRLFGVFAVGDAIPCLRWFDIGGHEKAMKETFKELDKIVSEWLEDHQHKRSLGGKVDGGQDIMDVLLELLDGTTIEGFDSDTIIKATILTLFLGGIDTSSVTLTWTLSLLLKNPHIMEKAKQELDTQVGRDRTVTESRGVQKMKLTTPGYKVGSNHF